MARTLLKTWTDPANPDRRVDWWGPCPRTGQLRLCFREPNVQVPNGAVLVFNGYYGEEQRGQALKDYNEFRRGSLTVLKLRQEVDTEVGKWREEK